ncbi:hypothetical protein PIB30_077049 [Stylosanthes scabra]|uniref:Uncharacterized protein n=1 Tax=Stylosanthes scabra TaxID=79078 RepID=A0ABU6VP56_9FABA|nr:hypothetical protein [Stylosanthes scabra]
MLCIRSCAVRMQPSRRGRASGVYKKTPLTLSFLTFHFSLFTPHFLPLQVPEYIPGAEPMEDEEEAPEYVPEGGMMENQDQAEEDPEEEPKEDPEEEPKMGKMEEEAEQDPNDDEDFVDYFELAPPPSPGSSNESLPHTDD